MTADTVRSGAAPSPGSAGHQPPRRGGWWHAYVCPVHHTELLAPDVDDPREHVCPHGCRLAGEPFDSAALVYRYQAEARRLRVLARDAAAGDADAGVSARALAVRLLGLHAGAGTGDWNADAAPWMLRGKLFHQALTEAIWATNVGHGLWTLRDADLVDADLATGIARFAADVAVNVIEARDVLVHDRADFPNNYTAWLNAAGAVASHLAGGDAARGPWLLGEHGQYAHVLAATGADGWEWEGATYYHVFVLRAYLLSMRGIEVAAVPAAVRDRLARMLAVLPAVAAPDGRLPALHDSPYRRDVSDQEVLEVVAIGRQLASVDGLDPLASAARTSLGERDDRLDTRLTGWLHGEPADLPALAGGGPCDLFEEVGYTVLRGRDGSWRALLDHGPHGGSHGHLDKLALYVESAAAWQPDAGITPYASGMRDHYGSTLAHPTFRVDGRDQQQCTGRLERFDVRGDAVTVVASADDAYPGVRASRTLHLHGGWLLDVVELASAEVKGTDAHELTLQFRPAVPVTLRATEDGFAIRWHDPAGDLATWHVTDADAVCRPVPLPGPADDPMTSATGIDWTVRGHHARFCTVWQPAGEAERDAVVAVHLEPDGVVVRTAAGSTHHQPL
ncbi:heparinase II/III family protein [Egicoccus sp. AB-alg2]|uniref:heparinase II/III domain-containing protein n=1 Tax=Egicoccus sp. AB-alg2 TaxID=3242693 RepID=UPI00359D9FB1